MKTILRRCAYGLAMTVGLMVQGCGGNVESKIVVDRANLKTSGNLMIIDGKVLVMDVTQFGRAGLVELVEHVALSPLHSTDPRIYDAKLKLLRVEPDGTGVFVLGMKEPFEIRGKPSTMDELARVMPIPLERTDAKLQVAVFRIILWSSARRE